MQIQLLTSFLRIDTLLDLLIRCFQASVFNAYQHILLLIRIHSCFNLDNLIIQEMSDFSVGVSVVNAQCQYLMLPPRTEKFRFYERGRNTCMQNAVHSFNIKLFLIIKKHVIFKD